MKKCLVISVFGGDIKKDGNSRVSNIVHSLETKDIDYTYITTDFVHRTKSYRNGIQDTDDIVYIHVPSYKKNISAKRLWSHIVFAVKLLRYLFSLRAKPYSVYCTMPTSTSAWVAGRYCKRNNIKFVIDVIDLWPDSLLPLTSLKKLLSILTLPWKWITVNAYKKADVIIGESKKYAGVAAAYNPDATVYPLYLGVDPEKTETLIRTSKLDIHKPYDELWIAYGGSLGVSYDFKTLVSSVATLNGKYKYKLLFIGDGVSRTHVESLINQYNVIAKITGYVSYADMLKYLSLCDIAINIFKKDTKVIHSYKFNDYVATNCFILNSLKGETSELIDKYQVGLNFDYAGNPLDKILLECVSNWDEYRQWKDNNKRLVSEVLDKSLIYPKISALLTD